MYRVRDSLWICIKCDTINFSKVKRHVYFLLNLRFKYNMCCHLKHYFLHEISKLCAFSPLFITHMPFFFSQTYPELLKYIYDFLIGSWTLSFKTYPDEHKSVQGVDSTDIQRVCFHLVSVSIVVQRRHFTFSDFAFYTNPLRILFQKSCKYFFLNKNLRKI